jgi:DNA polymerase-1
LQSKNAAIKKFGERAAINAPMQGTASDLVKKAMITISQHSKMQMILQVHDELIFEGPEAQLKTEAPAIQKMMESVVQWKVPLKVHWGIGPNWDECH